MRVSFATAQIRAAVENAPAFLAIQKELAARRYIWQFVDGQPVQNSAGGRQEICRPASALRRYEQGSHQTRFVFVGSTICWSAMQATGMVNDH
jgi:DNA-3-methyladenine glycosylase I